MLILRLSNSNDSHPAIPEELRAPAVAARRIAELTGETVETEICSIWPSSRLGDIVASRIEGSKPDVVLLRASSFWVNFESVPLKLERQVGGLAVPIARAGRNAGARYSVATNRAFKLARILGARTVGGTPYFTPPAATGHISTLLRRILTNESLIVVVRGPAHAHNAAHTAGSARRSEMRRAEFERLLAEECARLRVPFAPRGEPFTRAHLLPDDVHDSAEGHRINGELDREAVAAAWTAARTR